MSGSLFTNISNFGEQTYQPSGYRNFSTIFARDENIQFGDQSSLYSEAGSLNTRYFSINYCEPNYNSINKCKFKTPDELIFDKNIPDNILNISTCNVCIEIMMNPTNLKCGHCFCEGCVKKMKKCPLCRTEYTGQNLSPNYSIKNLIGEYKVYCPNKNCDWLGFIKNFNDHYKTCLETLLFCHWCSFPVEYKYIMEHFEKECDYRKIICKFCNAIYPFYKNSIHLNVCSRTKCECGEIIETSLLKKHQNICPVRIVKCKYCSSQFKVKDTALHFNSCAFFPVNCEKCSIQIPRYQLQEHNSSKKHLKDYFFCNNCLKKIPYDHFGSHTSTCTKKKPEYALFKKRRK